MPHQVLTAAQGEGLVLRGFAQPAALHGKGPKLYILSWQHSFLNTHYEGSKEPREKKEKVNLEEGS